MKLFNLIIIFLYGINNTTSFVINQKINIKSLHSPLRGYFVLSSTPSISCDTDNGGIPVINSTIMSA